jgi:hypothetical protein
MDLFSYLAIMTILNWTCLLIPLKYEENHVQSVQVPFRITIIIVHEQMKVKICAILILSYFFCLIGDYLEVYVHRLSCRDYHYLTFSTVYAIFSISLSSGVVHELWINKF